MRAHHEKRINLALQGGGAHGAFTWGVLDRLFEDDRLWIEAISGTSAGAMNAVVAAQGMYEGQAEGAREALACFWKAVSDAGKNSPIQRSPMDVLLGNWSLDASPSFLFFDMLQRIASPYDINPLNLNPLRDLVGELIDFNKVRNCTDLGLFIAATNVETGLARVFCREEMSIDVLMASACLPFMFQAVEIEGQHYWDGGFMGNPPLFPFFEGSDADDIAIIQINPVFRAGVPKNARDILNRVNEITFNSAMTHELRAIQHVTDLIRRGELELTRHREVRFHMIEARKRMRDLGASSKLNAEWPFLLHLFQIGRDRADLWLAQHYDDIGVRSTLDIAAMFNPQTPASLQRMRGGLAEPAIAPEGSETSAAADPEPVSEPVSGPGETSAPPAPARSDQ